MMEEIPKPTTPTDGGFFSIKGIVSSDKIHLNPFEKCVRNTGLGAVS